METLLLLAGGTVALYCLWQFRRWLGEARESGRGGEQRLETLVDELVATAEATSAVLQEKAEALSALIAEADRQVGALAAARQEVAVAAAPAPGAGPVAAPVAAAAPVPNPVAEPVPAGPLVPEMHRQVYALADSGQDLTTIARGLGLTKGEVQLILGIRKQGEARS